MVEADEATHDLEMLHRLLMDIRDLAGGEEAIFWRWVESRQTLVPSAWSTPDSRPAHFDIRSWGQLLRWSAEERMVQFVGGENLTPVLSAAPVLGTAGIYCVLSVSSSVTTLPHHLCFPSR